MTTAAERALKKHVAAVRAGDTQAFAEAHAILAAALHANSTTPYMRRVLAEMHGATGKGLKVDGRTYNSTEAEVQAVALSLTKTVLRPKAARDAKTQKGRAKGGPAAGKVRTEKWHPDCLDAARKLLTDGVRRPKGGIVIILAERFKRDPKTIRTVLKNAGIR